MSILQICAAIALIPLGPAAPPALATCQEARSTADTVEVKGSQIRLSGPLDEDTASKLLKALISERQVKEIVLVGMTQPADAAHVAEVGDLIAASNLIVRVEAKEPVAFAGTDLLMRAERRIVERGAAVSIDSAHYTEHKSIIGGDSPLEEALIDFMEVRIRTEVQGLELFSTGSSSSLRGLSAVSREVCWATGSGATVLRTVDGGRSWSNVAPPAIKGLDVRDVFAVDGSMAWIMTAGPGEASQIHFTRDGGRNWVEQYRETAPEAFLDGMDAFEDGRLLAYGDPMEDGRFRVVTSEDAGKTWTPSTTGPLALESGEASFAASGTGLRVVEPGRAWIVTGGTGGTGRVFSSEDRGVTWTPMDTPVDATGAGAGIFSIAMGRGGQGVVVGGDFVNREKGGAQNAAWTDDFGQTWTISTVGPRGQRAGSAALENGWFLATGQTGTDVSQDGGLTWAPFTAEGFHCVEASRTDGVIWFAGPGGKVARVR